MTEAEKVSELHQDVKNKLINEDFEKVKNWQKDSYHKQMMGGFKETKEAEEGFRKAQKPWAKKLKEVRTCVCLHIHPWATKGRSTPRTITTTVTRGVTTCSDNDAMCITIHG